MTDTLKEIYAGTLTYGNYSSGVQTLFTTDSATQYVIKDVNVTYSGFSYIESPLLTINGYAATTLYPGFATGWEVIDVGSTVRIKDVSIAPSFYDVAYMNNGGTSMALVSAGGLDCVSAGGFGATSHGLPTLTTITTALTAPYYFQKGALIGSNYFYYTFDGNSSACLYRRAGGVNGTEAQINPSTPYQAITWDSQNTFYWMNGGTLYIYNALTGTTTSIGGFNTGSTYPSLTICNNVIFWMATYNASGNIYCYDLGKSCMSYLSYSDQFSSSQSYAVPFFDAVNSKFIIYYGSSGNVSTLGCLTATYNATSGVVSAPVYSNNGSIVIGHTLWITQCTAFGNLAVFPGSGANTNSLLVFDSSMKLVASKSLPVAVFNGQTYYNTRVVPKASPTTAEKNTFGPSVTMRITGIKIT